MKFFKVRSLIASLICIFLLSSQFITVESKKKRAHRLGSRRSEVSNSASTISYANAKMTSQVSVGFINFNRFTPWNDASSGSIFYLDRHNVACQAGEVLQAFELETSTRGDQIRYKYFCSKRLAVGKKTQNLSTVLNDTDSNQRSSANYLDRHHVQCPDGFALQSFRQGRQARNGSKININYTCVEIQSTRCGRGNGETRAVRTYGKAPTYDLAGHLVFADQDAALTGFRLTSDYKKEKKMMFFTSTVLISLKYEVAYCFLKDLETEARLSAEQAEKERKRKEEEQKKLEEERKKAEEEAKKVVEEQIRVARLAQQKLLTTFNSFTPESSVTNNILATLINHRVRCDPGTVLTGLHYKTLANKFNFEYNCKYIDGLNIKGKERTFQTKPIPVGDGKSTAFIDEQCPKCPELHVLTSFQFLSKTGQSMYTVYSCMPISSPANCKTVDSPSVNAESPEQLLANLNEIYVNFFKGKGINSISLQKKDKAYNFSFTVCDNNIKEETSLAEANPAPPKNRRK